MEARTVMRVASLTRRTSTRRPLSPSNPWGRGQVSSKGLWTQGCPSKHAQGLTTGRSARTINHRATGRGRGTVVFPGAVPNNHLTLQACPQPHARLPTGAGGLGLPSMESRRKSASIGRRVGILPLGDRVRRGLPESSIIAQLGDTSREIRDT